MTTSGTWYYPPCTGTGNLLLTNPPFIMDTNPAKGLPDLTEEEFQQLSVAAGGSNQFEACNYAHALRIAQRAYQMGGYDQDAIWRRALEALPE
jgi:hypothetical protein